MKISDWTPIEFRLPTSNQHYTELAAKESAESIYNTEEYNLSGEKGVTGLFTFPFRFYCLQEIEDCEFSNQELKFKVHRPFVINSNISPLTIDIPFEKWPNFSWAPGVNNKNKLAPVTRGFTAFPKSVRNEDTSHYYDSIRIDLWTQNNIEIEFRDRTKLFFDWLRLLSGQPWINAVETHHSNPLKHKYFIDKNGNCIEPPRLITFNTRANISLLTNTMWRRAIENTVLGIPIEPYWNVYFDSQIKYSQKDYWQAILLSMLSIDICRNIIFKRLFSEKEFKNETNLEYLFSKFLEKKINRNLQQEDPKLWLRFIDLFLTRHNLAHGKILAKRQKKDVPITEDIVMESILTAPLVISWLQSLISK